MEYFIDTINSFVLEHKKNLSSYNIDQFQYAVESKIEGNYIPSPILPDPTRYCQYIDKALDYVNRVCVKSSELTDFYNRICKSRHIDILHTRVTIQAADTITKIRPEYISNTPMEFDKVIQDILKGKAKDIDIKINYVAGEYFMKLRRQIVKSPISYNDVKSLLTVNTITTIKLSNFLIENEIIPFLEMYDKNVKEIITIAQNAKGIIRNATMDIGNSMKAISELESGGSLDYKQIKQLAYFKYNFYREYMNICAYAVTSIMRKMNYLVYNMREYINLYNKINDIFPCGEGILHEFVESFNDDHDVESNEIILDCALHNNINKFIPIIRSSIDFKKIQLSNIFARYNKKLDYFDMSNPEYPYDTGIYRSIDHIINEIYDHFYVFETNLNNTDMIVDDVLTSSDMDTLFLMQYSDVLSVVDSMNFYTEQESIIGNNDMSVILSVYTELCNFEENLYTVSGNLHKVYIYAYSIYKKFDLNQDLDRNTIDEYKSAMKIVIKNFEDFALYLVKKLINRSDNLISLLDSKIPSTQIYDSPSNIESDYTRSVYSEAYDEICEAEKKIFIPMMKDYYAKRKKSETGAKIVFEETGEAPENAKNASVKTDANAQHSQNNANKTSSSNSDVNNKETIIKKFQEWFKQLLDRFRKKSSDLVRTNNKWLSSVKSDIQNLDMSNTTINLAKYDGLSRDSVLNVINSATNKINSINVSNLSSDLSDRSKAESYLFNAIPSKVGNETNFVARIKHFYTFGNINNTKLISYSGDDAKEKVSDIISFCEAYDDTYKAVSNALDKLSKSASKKQQEIINNLGTQTQTTRKITNESTIFEAQQTISTNNSGTSNVNKDSITKSSILTAITREYSGAILTVLEKKYLDYIKVLSKLAPKRETGVTQNKNSESTTTDSSNDLDSISKRDNM